MREKILAVLTTLKPQKTRKLAQIVKAAVLPIVLALIAVTMQGGL